MSELDNFRKKVEEGEFATITLFLDDNNEMDYDISAIFQVEDKVYIALTPIYDYETEEVFLYRLSNIGDDDLNLENIVDDEEFELVRNAFDELSDEADYKKWTTEDGAFTIEDGVLVEYTGEGQEAVIPKGVTGIDKYLINDFEEHEKIKPECALN